MIVRGELFDFNSLPLNSRMRISFEDMNILNGEDYLRSLEMYKLYSSEDLVDRINDILEIASFIEIVPSIESVSKHENVERETVLKCPSAEEVFEQLAEQEQLYDAMMALTHKQRTRLYAHFFLNMSYRKIAQQEGVDVSSVKESVYRAVHQLQKKFLIL